MENVKVERQGLVIKLTSPDSDVSYCSLTYNPVIKTGIVIGILGSGHHHVVSHKTKHFIVLLDDIKAKIDGDDPKIAAIDVVTKLIAKL